MNWIGYMLGMFLLWMENWSIVTVQSQRPAFLRGSNRALMFPLRLFVLYGAIYLTYRWDGILWGSIALGASWVFNKVTFWHYFRQQSHRMGIMLLKQHIAVYGEPTSQEEEEEVHRLVHEKAQQVIESIIASN